MARPSPNEENGRTSDESSGERCSFHVEEKRRIKGNSWQVGRIGALRAEAIGNDDDQQNPEHDGLAYEVPLERVSSLVLSMMMHPPSVPEER